MAVWGVSRAHFHPPALREVYIKLPDEDAEPGKVGILRKTMYGTRDAAAQWEKYYTDALKELGFVGGLFCPCLLHHPRRGIAMWVHGDDMVGLGTRRELERL